MSHDTHADAKIVPNAHIDPNQQKNIRPNPDEPYQPTEPDDLESPLANLPADTDSQSIETAQPRSNPPLDNDAGLGDTGLNYTGLGDSGLSDGVRSGADDPEGDKGLGSDSALGNDLDADEDTSAEDLPG